MSKFFEEKEIVQLNTYLERSLSDRQRKQAKKIC